MKPTPEMIKKAKLLTVDGYACTNKWECTKCPLHNLDCVPVSNAEKLAAEWLKQNGVEE